MPRWSASRCLAATRRSAPAARRYLRAAGLCTRTATTSATSLRATPRRASRFGCRRAARRSARSTTPRRTSPSPATPRARGSYSLDDRSRRSNRPDFQAKERARLSSRAGALISFSVGRKAAFINQRRRRGRACVGQSTSASRAAVSAAVARRESPAPEFARGILFGVALAVLCPETADLQSILNQLPAHAEVAGHLD